MKPSFRWPLLFLTSMIFLARAAPRVDAAAGSPPISVDEYWRLVDHAQQVIAGLKGLPPDQAKEPLAELAAQWERVDQVTLDDGGTIHVDNSYLLSLLRLDPPDPGRIESVLRRLQAAHKTYPAGVFTTADLESLKEVLARPEFQWQAPAPNPIAEWFRKLWERFNRWLQEILGGGRFSVPGGVFDPLPLISTLLLAVVLFYIARTLFVDLVGEARIDDGNGEAREPLTSGSAFSKAQALSRGGDYRSAVRYLYLSSLLLLDERGLLRYDRFKTNHEYLRSVSGQPGLAGPLRDVIEVFDDVWYGYHALDEDTFKHYSDRVEELKEKKQ